MNIHQLSVRYVPEQDRILLSVNTTDGQELDLWLTRRMVLAMWPQLNRMAMDHFAVPADAKTDGFVDLSALDTGTRQVLADTRRQELLQNADFKTPYRATAKTRPMGASPLLPVEITLKPLDAQQVEVHFKEQPGTAGSGRGLQLALQAQLVFSLVHMLSQSMEHTGWFSAAPTGLGHWQGPSLAGGPLPSLAEPADESISSGDDRPRYLN